MAPFRLNRPSRLSPGHNVDPNDVLFWVASGFLAGLLGCWAWAEAVDFLSKSPSPSPAPTPPLQRVTLVPIPDALQKSAEDLHASFELAQASAQKAVDAEAAAVAARAAAEAAKADANNVATAFQQKLVAHQSLQTQTYTLPAIPKHA